MLSERARLRRSSGTANIVMRAGVLLASLAGSISSLSAQQVVTGTVADATTGAPILAVLVEARGATGRSLETVLADDHGRFRLRVDSGQIATVRAEALGYRSASTPVNGSQGVVAGIRLHLEPAPVALEGLHAEADRRCRSSPDEAPVISGIWDELRKALRTVAWVEAKRRFTYRTATWRRRRSLGHGIVQRADEAVHSGWGLHPFRSLSSSEIESHGFIREEDGVRVYHAPDAGTLLSDAFLGTHCFALVVDEDRERVGLGFRPIRDRGMPDIEGVIWVGLDGALRSLEFTWVDEELRSVEPGHLGGEVVFSRLEGGEWIVSRWELRLPVWGRRHGALADRRGRRELAAIDVVGGEVLEHDRLGVRAAESYGAVHGRVVRTGSGGPLTDATVYLSGTQYRATTDSTGRFSLPSVREGRYRPGVIHAAVDDLPRHPELPPLELAGGEVLEVELEIPAPATLLRDECEAPIAGTRIVGGRAFDRLTGNPLGFGSARLEWTRITEVREGGVRTALTEAHTDLSPEGWFVFCDAPADYPLELTVSVLGRESRARALKPRPEAAFLFDLEVPLTDPLTVAGEIRDAGSGRSVPDVLVTIGQSEPVLSDEDGSFVISGVIPGSVQIRFEHLAYGTLTDTVLVQGNQRVHVDVTLAPEAIPLDPINVTVQSGLSRELRARGTRVDALGEEEIAEILPRVSDIADLVRAIRAPGVTIVREPAEHGKGSPGICIELNRLRGLGCNMVAVFVDDLPLPDPSRRLGLIPVDQIVRIELLPPLEAGGMVPGGRNGALLIYMR